MSRGMRHYQSPAYDAATPRENEIVAFRLANAGLEAASNQAERIRALYKNQQLWSVILKDVGTEENGLPSDLKAQIAELSLWAMTYSTIAMTKDLALEPLLRVNQDMADGLRAQTAGALARTAGAASQGARIAI